MSMNIQRFQAPTAREALALARAVFGASTLVLSNRQVGNGVEVLAAAEAELSSVDQMTLHVAAEAPRDSVATANGAINQRLSLPAGATTQEVVLADTEQLAMSTLSFQDYVRERMLRRQQEDAVRAPADDSRSTPRMTEHKDAAPLFEAVASQRPLTTPTKTQPAPTRDRGSDPAPAATHENAAALEMSKSVMSQLQAMKQLMEDRFNTLAWLSQARQDPIHSHLMLKLVRAGYSAALARTVLEPIAAKPDASAAVCAVMESLGRMLSIDTNSPCITDEGGIFALTGATGVGKTTTVAKLASQCARVHGASSVGLVTLDVHRAGAHEQLRAFARSLGMVAHLAHDCAALQELLVLLAGKKLVLIDTPGVAPRDPRRREILEMLDLPGVKQVLVLNAGAHGDTLEEVASGFSIGGTTQAVLTKIDEAAKLGPALDTLMRHKFALRGVGTGQRIPEDWKMADSAELVRDSMRAAKRLPFDPASSDLDFYFSPAECSV